MVVQAKVLSFRKVREGDDNYTAFTVDVWVSGIHHSLEKRYSEFEELHKMLKKVMKTPEFPPKKVLKWNPKVLEQRRAGLDSYFKGLLERDTLPHPLLMFLDADFINSIEFMNEQAESMKTTHQPVIVLDSSLYLQERNNNDLPNIVCEGVLLGLYSPGQIDLALQI